MKLIKHIDQIIIGNVYLTTVGRSINSSDFYNICMCTGTELTYVRAKTLLRGCLGTTPRSLYLFNNDPIPHLYMTRYIHPMDTIYELNNDEILEDVVTYLI